MAGANYNITKAQAAALADGFLDSIGSDDKSGLTPKNALSELMLIVAEMVEEMQENLIHSKLIASGRLAESIAALEPEIRDDKIVIDIIMNFYGKFQNKGVRGTRSGSGLYQFRDEFPSKKMVIAIQEWLDRANKSIRTVKQYKNYGRHEQKNRDISQLYNAYAVARSIKIKGLKPSGFLDKAADSAERKMAERIGVALKVDIIDAIRPKTSG